MGSATGAMRPATPLCRLLLRGVESQPCFRLLRSAEPAQFRAFREPMATVVPPDEAENLVEDDTGDRGRKDDDDERRTVVSREYLDRRVLGVLHGQDDGQDRHCNADNESDADTGGASIDGGSRCKFVGAPCFGQ